MLNEQDIICYSKKAENRDTLFKIALPVCMIAETIAWFHIVTGHPGKSKLRLTIGQRYYHPICADRLTIIIVLSVSDTNWMVKVMAYCLNEN